MTPLLIPETCKWQPMRLGISKMHNFKEDHKLLECDTVVDTGNMEWKPIRMDKFVNTESQEDNEVTCG